MSKMRKAQATASAKELQELRRVIREAVQHEMVLKEGWRDWFGSGAAKEAEKEPSAQEKYASGEGRVWQALNKISPQMSIADVLKIWKSSIKDNVESVKKMLKGDEKVQFDGIVSSMESLEKLDDLQSISADDVGTIRSLLKSAADGATNISDKIAKYKQSAKPTVSATDKKPKRGRDLYAEPATESKARKGRKI